MDTNSYEFSAKTVSDAITAASVSLGVTSNNLEYKVLENGSSGFLGIGSKDAKILITSVNGQLVGKAAEEAAEAAKEEESRRTEREEKTFSKFDRSKASVEETSIASSDDSKESEESADRPERSSEDSADRPSVSRRNPNHEPSDEACIDIANEFLKDVFEKMNLEVTINSTLLPDDNILEIELEGPEMGIIIGKRGQTLDSLQYLTNLAVNRKVDVYTIVKIDTEDYRKRRKETLENLARNCAYKVKRSRKPYSLESMSPYERRIIHFALQNDKYVETHSEGEEPYRHVVITPKRFDS